MWSYKSANFNNFRTKLTEVDWDECLASEDPDQAVNEWTTKFLEVVTEEIPHKEVTVRPTENRWYNGYLRRLCRKQSHDHKLWTKHRTPWAWERYRSSRNTYHQEVDRLKLEKVVVCCKGDHGEQEILLDTINDVRKRGLQHRRGKSEVIQRLLHRCPVTTQLAGKPNL